MLYGKKSVITKRYIIYIFITFRETLLYINYTINKTITYFNELSINYAEITHIGMYFN